MHISQLDNALMLCKNATMHTTIQPSSIEHFLSTFAGRRDMEGYDESKPIKIAECNRDFVWTKTMQRDFICSILKGYPIPPMCIVNGQIVDGGNRSTTLWLFKNGKFSITLDGIENISYDHMCTDRVMTRRWDSAVFAQQIVSDATPDEFAQIYENLNKGVQLTIGQLLENRKHRSWVAMAEAMIGRGSTEYSDRVLLQSVWTDAFRTTQGRKELAWAFQVLVGAELGPAHFHLRFTDHCQLIMGTTEATTGRLHVILDMINSCDVDHVVSLKKKKDIFQKFIGSIIYDNHTMEAESWKEKWTGFIHQAYNTLGEKDIKKIINVGNKRASSSTKIQKISENVSQYLDGEFESDASSYSDEEDSID